jgi:hypothetical protein
MGGQAWLTQLQLADLYQTTKQNISLHVRNILSEGELSEEATVKDNLTVQTEGSRQVSRKLSHYSLPMVVADRPILNAFDLYTDTRLFG